MFLRLEEAVVPTTTSTLVPPWAALVERARHTAMEVISNLTDQQKCEDARSLTNYNEGEGGISHAYHSSFVIFMEIILVFVSTK